MIIHSHSLFQLPKSKSTCLLFLLVFAFGLQNKAQDNLSRGLQFNGFTADILPHSEDIRALSYTQANGLSAAYFWQHSRSGNSYEYPIKSRKGFKLQYVNFNNPVKLGNAYSISGFTEPMMGSNRKLFISFPIEAGFVGLTQIYDPVKNPENLFFSTPLSFYLSAGLQFNYKLSNKLLIQSAIQYQHISNGGIKMPNKGMNFLSIHLGSAYYFNEPNWQKSILKKEPVLNKNSWEVYLMGTAKTLSPSNELKPMMGIQTSYIRKFNHFHALLFSSEGLYNTHKKASEKNSGNEINAWDQSILLGYQLSIGATRFQVSFAYPILGYFNKRNIYQRYMLIRNLSKKWQLAGSLKAEGHVADIFDLRIGYRFSN